MYKLLGIGSLIIIGYCLSGGDTTEVNGANSISETSAPRGFDIRYQTPEIESILIVANIRAVSKENLTDSDKIKKIRQFNEMVISNAGNHVQYWNHIFPKVTRKLRDMKDENNDNKFGEAEWQKVIDIIEEGY